MRKLKTDGRRTHQVLELFGGPVHSSGPCGSAWAIWKMKFSRNTHEDASTQAARCETDWWLAAKLLFSQTLEQLLICRLASSHLGLSLVSAFQIFQQFQYNLRPKLCVAKRNQYEINENLWFVCHEIHANACPCSIQDAIAFWPNPTGDYLGHAWCKPCVLGSICPWQYLALIHFFQKWRAELYNISESCLFLSLAQMSNALPTTSMEALGIDPAFSFLQVWASKRRPQNFASNG